MAYQYDRGRRAFQPRVETGPVVQQARSAPNSALSSMLGIEDAPARRDLDGLLRTRLAALRHQIPEAEAEADRFACGVRARSEEGVKTEMGARMGADFSNVRFHTDHDAAERADELGARAFTSGADVYFGAGSFDANVAAHELTHTVQQGAVAGEAATVSAPLGGVQMMPGIFQWILDKWNAVHAPAPAPPPPPDDPTALHVEVVGPSPEPAQPPAPAPAPMPAPPLVVSRRPWEMTADDLANDRFNPGRVMEVEQIQAQIDAANDPQTAFTVFSTFAGDPNARMRDLNGEWNPTEVDMGRFRAKLKNMARMVFDYPELKTHLGDMFPTQGGEIMGATSTKRGTIKSNFTYNADEDRAGAPQAPPDPAAPPFNTADLSYAGTHELGHVLNSLILDPSNVDEDWEKAYTADDMLQSVLQRHPEIQPRIHLDTAGRRRIDVPGSHFDQQVTAGYGAGSDAGEIFAEAMADVYEHGANARPISIELVKEYESRRPHP